MDDNNSRLVSDSTLMELLAKLESPTRRQICLICLYHRKIQGIDSCTASDIRYSLSSARIMGSPQWNITDILRKSGQYIDRSLTNNVNQWVLTKTGTYYVESLLGIKNESVEIRESRASLSKVLLSVTDEVARDYLNEALRCFEFGCLRATVVFAWSGAIRTLQEKALANYSQHLETCFRKHEPKAGKIGSLEDFARYRDTIQLLAFRDLGIIDKSEWRALQHGLDLRNDFGHPSKLRPGSNQVAAFLESIISVAFR